MTMAKWMREFVAKHPDYKQDSIITDKINYDLLRKCDRIAKGEEQCPELIGNPVNRSQWTRQEGKKYCRWYKHACKERPKVWLGTEEVQSYENANRHLCNVKKCTCFRCMYVCVCIYCMRFLWLQCYFNRWAIRHAKGCVIEIRCVFIFIWKLSLSVRM